MIWILGLLACFIFISLIVKSIVTPRELDLGVASKDLLIYKDQLVEVEKDLEKGVLSIAESEAAKIEVSRRILLADKRSKSERQKPNNSQKLNKSIAFIILTFILIGSFGTYAFLGNPNIPDMPLKSRLAKTQEIRSQRIAKRKQSYLFQMKLLKLQMIT